MPDGGKGQGRQGLSAEVKTRNATPRVSGNCEESALVGPLDSVWVTLDALSLQQAARGCLFHIVLLPEWSLFHHRDKVAPYL